MSLSELAGPCKFSLFHESESLLLPQERIFPLKEMAATQWDVWEVT